jgi:hypothetical protein
MTEIKVIKKEVTNEPKVACIGDEPWKPLVIVTSSHKTVKLTEDL